MQKNVIFKFLLYLAWPSPDPRQNSSWMTPYVQVTIIIDSYVQSDPENEGCYFLVIFCELTLTLTFLSRYDFRTDVVPVLNCPGTLGQFELYVPSSRPQSPKREMPSFDIWPYIDLTRALNPKTLSMD